jgi:uncharacterized protein (TIRG00374 family)
VPQQSRDRASENSGILLVHGRLIVVSALAAGLLWLAAKGTNWHELRSTVQNASWPMLALALGLVNGSLWLRSLRWGVLLRAAQPAAPLAVFGAMCLGYLSNNLLPARAGDVIRSAAISRKTRISFAYAVATTMAERLVDVATLVLIGLMTIHQFGNLPGWLTHALWIMAGLCGLGIAALILLASHEATICKIVSRIRVRQPAVFGVVKIAREFLLGLRTFLSLRCVFKVSGLTIIVWLIDALAMRSVAQALSLSLPFTGALMFLAALGLSSAVPSTPGYVGIYQYVAVTVLMPIGVSRSGSIALILLYQGIAYCSVLLWSVLISWRDVKGLFQKAYDRTNQPDVVGSTRLTPD